MEQSNESTLNVIVKGLLCMLSTMKNTSKTHIMQIIWFPSKPLDSWCAHVCQESSAVDYCGLGMSCGLIRPHHFVTICHPS